MNSFLNDLSSADAVLSAIEEYEQLGRDQFLQKYGYRAARGYLLRHNGRYYDSKAIAGVAYGNQHGSALTWGQFSGGAATVSKCLARLGFQVVKTDHPLAYLRRGVTYFRKDLVVRYGGQLQSGIWTPKEFDVVFIFSGASGKSYGYEDKWTGDGIFLYTGEGQVGPMRFRAGNKAIRDHRKDGKDLLLFTDLGKNKGVRYEGVFECASWDHVEAPDKTGKLRQAIVFGLLPTHIVAEIEMPAIQGEGPSVKASLEELRKAAYDASSETAVHGSSSEARNLWRRRSEAVKRYVSARSNGLCEACGEKAPFVKKDGEPYLEPHHTTRLADDGPDHPAWVGAICPTCHRRIHSGVDGDEWNLRLQRRLQGIEKPFEPFGGRRVGTDDVG